MTRLKTHSGLALVALVLLTTALPFSTAAQQDAQPMWVDRISASHVPGRELADPLTLTVDVHVISHSGAVTGTGVSILIVGPAGEQIAARGTTERDGFARVSAQIPGGGPYEVVVMSLYQGAYFYDPNLDTHAFPGYFILPVGQVHVADSLDRIRQFTTDGVFVREWQTNPNTPANQSDYSVRHLTLDSAGNVYASLFGTTATGTSGLCEIHKYTSYGVLINVIGGACADGPGQLGYFRVITVDSQDNLYAIETEHVEIFDASGSHLSTWALPLGLVVSDAVIDHEDNLYLVDIETKKIFKFNSSGLYLLSWSMVDPWSIAVDSSNRIHVTTLGTPAAQPDHVYVFTSTGQPITSWTNANGVSYEDTLDLDASDRVYLANGGVFANASTYISKYTSNGMFLLEWDALVGTAPWMDAQIKAFAVYH